MTRLSRRDLTQRGNLLSTAGPEARERQGIACGKDRFLANYSM
jgi:hypothetical protein